MIVETVFGTLLVVTALAASLGLPTLVLRQVARAARSH
jgi:hypothetical protein